jgi:hypothetical protein
VALNSVFPNTSLSKKALPTDPVGPEEIQLDFRAGKPPVQSTGFDAEDSRRFETRPESDGLVVARGQVDSLGGDLSDPEFAVSDQPTRDARNGRWLTEWSQDLIPPLTSLVVHLILLVGLAMLLTRVDQFAGPETTIELGWSDAGDSLEMVEFSSVAPSGGSSQAVDALIPSNVPTSTSEMPEMDLVLDDEGPAPTVQQPSLVQSTSLSDVAGVTSTSFRGAGLGKRDGDGHAEAVGKRGGSPESEAAVDRALAWFVEHQQTDGSWSLRLDQPPCNGRCPNGAPGSDPMRAGATGLALLCFLGRGYTDQSGPYQKEVGAAINYLVTKGSSKAKIGIRMASPTSEGAMYEHGIATLALCEAYQMTGNAELAPFCQDAINYIKYAQHSDGSWDYDPKRPGDLSIACWQMMALKSAVSGDLKISQYTLDAFNQFLDRQQSDEGAQYRYRTLPPTMSMTSIGLLMRLYLTWGMTDPSIIKGVQSISAVGPSMEDVYYNYYATQLLFHYGRSDWDQWNAKMRDYLVNTQSRGGHANGSWFFDQAANNHNKVGGRLYCTAMATLTLEVYYRFLPLHESVEIGVFKL